MNFKFLRDLFNRSESTEAMMTVTPDGYRVWRNNHGLNRQDGPAVIQADGTKEWWRNGERHREDGPAIEYANGTKAWYLKGQRLTDKEIATIQERTEKSGRESAAENDAAAIKTWFGDKKWHNKNGKLHRDDGPAYKGADGNKAWYRDGQRHRDDGPAVEDANGNKEWYRNGQLHRDDGPAVEDADGYKAWYRNGQLHREDGPAIERADGSKQFWRDDQLLSTQERTAKGEPALPAPPLQPKGPS